MAQIGTIRQSLFTSKAHVLLDPPQQIGPGLPRQIPQPKTEKLPVRQAQHARLQARQYGFGQGDLTRSIVRHLAAEQHVRAVLDQGNKADLRIGAAATAGSGPAEGLVVGRLVRNIQRAAVQADQPPLPIPGPPGRPNRDRLHHFVMQLTHRFPSEPRARLRNARLARHLDGRRRIEKPLHALQQATQHFAIGRMHIQRQRNHVIDHHVRRQIALAHAGSPVAARTA